MTKGNEPAFDSVYGDGLTKREYIATSVLQGLRAAMMELNKETK